MDFSWTEDDCADSATLHGVGDAFGDVELNILTKFVLEIVKIDVRKIVDDVAWR